MEGQQGNLVTFENLNGGKTPSVSVRDSVLHFDFKQKVVGFWKVVKLPGTEKLAVIIKLKNGVSFDLDSERFITLIDGKVYVGEHKKAMKEFEVNKELNLNKIAFGDIIESLR